MNALDPRDPLQKKRFKASITDAIAKEIDGSDRIDIATRVENLYERLLLKAVVFTHIPSLTAGMVRRDVMTHKATHFTLRGNPLPDPAPARGG
jgi:hypothetical protein